MGSFINGQKHNSHIIGKYANENQFIENYQAKGWTLLAHPNWKYLKKGMEGIAIYSDGEIVYASLAVGEWRYETLQDWYEKKPSSVKEYRDFD
jgi:hypothetical protein